MGAWNRIPEPLPPDGAGTRLAFVDALRGFAILGVVVYHTFQYTQPHLPGLNATLGRFCEQGARGVQLFFLVSAFTLCLSVREGQAQGRFSLRRFYVNRFFRIAPLFWLAILFYAWEARLSFSRGFQGGAELSWPALLAAASFANAAIPQWVNSPVPGGWSIAAEMGFYLPFPFLLARLRNGTWAAYLVLAALLARAGITGFLENRSPLADPEAWRNYLFFWLPNHLPVFALGMGLYFLHAADRAASERTSAAPSAKPGGTARTGALAWLLCGGFLLFSLVKGSKLLLPFHFQYALGFFLVAAALSRRPYALLCNRLTVALGRISYSAYICHFAVLDFAVEFALPRLAGRIGANALFPVFFLGIMAATVPLSLLLFHGVERPGQNLGRYLLRRTGETGAGLR